MQTLAAIAKEWAALDASMQAVIIGFAGYGIVRLIQWKFPGIKCTPNEIKRVLIAVGVGLTAFAATGEIGAAIAAALNAFGFYDVISGSKDKRASIAKAVEEAKKTI